MEYRRLGSSGLLVSSLALGTMIFGEDSPRSTPPDEAERMIHRYLDAGGNHIDTANVYAAGRAEEITGRALRGRRPDVILATKVRFPTGEGPNQVGLSRYHIQNSVEASLRRLETDVIDLLYMHAWDPLTPVAESLRAFDDLVRSGKVRYIGVSNFKAWQLMKALCTSDAHGWERFVAAQYQFSLVERDIEREFLDLCQSEGVGLVPWGPLGGGFLSGKYRREHRPQDPEEGRLATAKAEWEEAWDRRATTRNWDTLGVMEDLLTQHPGLTHSQLSLAWLLSRPAVSSVIIGVRTFEQLEDNLSAAQVQLSPEELDRLDQVSRLPEGYPYRFLAEAAR
jgi:aryl-alcohol dehydrogenase-like predicted oxidoreductase